MATELVLKKIQKGVHLIGVVPKFIAMVKRGFGWGGVVLFFISMANTMTDVTDSAIIRNVSSCLFYL